MITVLENLKQRFLTIKEGETVYGIETRFVSEKSEVRPMRVSKVGREYVYLGGHLRADRKCSSNRVDSTRVANYVTQHHYVFATQEEAQKFLDGAKELDRKDAEWRAFNNEFQALSRDMSSWGSEKRQRVLDAMKGEGNE